MHTNKTGTFQLRADMLMLLFCIAWLSSCSDEQVANTKKKINAPDSLSLFKQLPSSVTGIFFNNSIREDASLNALTYEYTYNGGGVAVGDFNNDGQDDIFFTANQRPNRLYLNKGAMKFQDITALSGAGGRSGSWKTGATVVDINADGLLDIYVCYSGPVPAARRANELLINKGMGKNGIPIFKDEAATWGLADTAFSVQAGFFDFDKDGDLDMILINHAPHPYGNLDEASLAFLRRQPDGNAGLKLFRNDKMRFKDISLSAGMDNSGLNFSLGLSIADVNNDNWPDLYISNDYMAPDRLYINQRNGRFTDRLGDMIGYTSEFSMGNDISDINNDGFNDILTLDMLPEDNHRQKLLSSIDNYEFFELRNRSGLHPQFMRNMLHINNGNNSFSEVAQLSGISNTDWSWAPLFADYDNDGWKDLFVSNGFVHDYTNLDFLKYVSDNLRQSNYQVRDSHLLRMAAGAPSSDVVNYIFKNNGNLTFTNMSAPWGFTLPTNSAGAAYADFDNDGDLDLVVNNTNQLSAIFQNNANRLSGNNYLRLILKGEKNNTLGIGAKIRVYADSMFQTLEQLAVRGYQSGVSPILHFGLGKATVVDSIIILWPGGLQQQLKNVAANTTLTLNEKNATQRKKENDIRIETIFQSAPALMGFNHQENPVNDFKRQPLLTGALSFNGPCMIKGDVNGDGVEDIYIGGASGQPGSLFLQDKNGKFKERYQKSFEQDAISEDIDGVFTDVDNDGDLDLYVASGGYDQFDGGDAALQDRIYLNNGKGDFQKSDGALPDMRFSTGTVSAADINADGFVDLFIGGRVIPGRYPEMPESFLLINDGKGHFKNEIERLAKGLSGSGLITTSAFADFDGDRQPDLVIAGEFMPVKIWINRKGIFSDATPDFFEKPVYGYWNKLVVDDLNNDGSPDIVAGNLGLNSQLKCSEAQPVEMHYKDFDENGSVDPILCYYIQGKSYPAVLRDELLDQISFMRTRFTDYKSYADATLQDVFTDAELAGAKTLRATSFASAVFLSSKTRKFIHQQLPIEAQSTPVYALAVADVDGDRVKDIILGGNVSHARLRFGYCRAGRGLLLKGSGNGNFRAVGPVESGLNIAGDVRSLTITGNRLLVGRNNQSTIAYAF